MTTMRLGKSVQQLKRQHDAGNHQCVQFKIEPASKFKKLRLPLTSLRIDQKKKRAKR